jgi:hypothetical protein
MRCHVPHPCLSQLTCASLSAGVLQELLDASGLGHVTHLTRTEWSVLRGAMGRPRRLSLAFLKQERHKLEAYRYTHVACRGFCDQLGSACTGHTKAGHDYDARLFNGGGGVKSYK